MHRSTKGLTRRRLGLASVLTIAAATCLACLACLVGAGAAVAADTLSVAVNPVSPEQDVPAGFTFSGSAQPVDNAGDGPNLEVEYRPTGGIGCQSSFQADQATAGSVSTVLAGGNDAPWNSTNYPYSPPKQGPGAFANTYDYRVPQTGSYLLCAYLEYTRISEESEETVVEASTSTTFTVTAPKIEVFNVSLGGQPQPGQLFTIDYTTQTDQQLRLNSIIVPAGGLACAASAGLFEEELSQDNGVSINLFNPDYYEEGEGRGLIYGGPITTQVTANESAAGPYVICTWIEGPNSGEVDATADTPFYVGSPPPTPHPTPKPRPKPMPRCIVPSFNRRMRLHAVERRLRGSHCSVGRITHVHSRRVKRGGVIRLGARPGTYLPHDARVAIVLSSGRAARRGRRHR